MSDDLTDRLRKWEHIPIANEAADEIDRLRQGVKVYGEALGNTQRSLKRAEATIAALLAVPDDLAVKPEDYGRDTWQGGFETGRQNTLDRVRARMAGVVEGERGSVGGPPTEPQVGSRWLPKADLTAEPRTVTAVGWSINKVWRVWWVGPDGKHGAAPELDLFLDGHVRMAAVVEEEHDA